MSLVPAPALLLTGPLLILGAAPAACGSPQEGPPVRFERHVIPVGGSPYALAAADVTGDGRVDLVVAGAAPDSLSVLVGDGRGGFRRAGEVAAGENPVGLAAADVDGDGDVDLAVANHETDYVTLLLGDGDGGFEPAPSSPLRVDVDPHPHAVALVDVDGDGRADLLVDQRGGEGLLLLRGRGDGTFGDARLVGMGGDPYRGMEVVDLNGDGRPDLVTPNPRSAGVRLGRGDGTFAPVRTVDVAPLAPFAVAVADVNGDGHPDVGVGSGEAATEVAVLTGDGTGAFRPVAGSPYRVGRGAKSMDAADLDGDGADDLVVASWESRDLAILFGGPDGMRVHGVGSGEHPWAVTAADLDGDGRPDVAVGNYGEGTVTVLLTRGR